MASDGTIVIDTKVDQRGIRVGVKQIKIGFSDSALAVRSLKQEMNGLSGTVKKIGGIITAAFAVKQIVSFGRECVDLGSDLQEVQNVVDVTFTTMSKMADEFAKNAAVGFGLSETMAKRYVGTFGSMAKAFGFSERVAYDMSTALTGLAGDVASFYNITQDEAYTKLKSVFTGETESLKDLGVVMTQSALDQYALANGFGKTTAAMTEQEKVALRYEFVVNQLSAASGDFARTSGSWANQVRILKLQFDSLKATIGQGLINLFTPIIKVINTLLGKLATLANAFKSFTELITGKKSSGSTNESGAGLDGGVISEMGNAYEQAAIGADQFADSTGSAANATKKAEKAAKGYLSSLDEIKKFETEKPVTDIPSSSGGSGGSTGGISPIDYGSIAEGETVIDKVDSKMSEMLKNLLALLKPTTEALKKLWNEGLSRLGDFTWEALKGFYHNFLVPVGTWALGEGIPRLVNALNDGLMKVDFDRITASLNRLWQVLAPFAIRVGDGLVWFWENALVPLGTWVANEVVPRFLDTLSISIGALNEILTALQPLFQWFWDNVLQPIATWVGGVFLDVWDGINSALQKFSTWCAENPETIQIITTIVMAFLAAWKLAPIVTQIGSFIKAGFNIISMVKSVSGAMTLLKHGLSVLAGGFNPVTLAIGAVIAAGVLLWQNWDTIKEKASEIFEKLKTIAKDVFGYLQEKIFAPFITWLTSIFQKDWTESFGAFGEVLNGFFKSVEEIWGDIKEIFNGIVTFITGVFTGDWEKALGGLVKIFTGVFEGIGDIAKLPINGIITAFNAVISIINGLISKVNSISFKITVPDWIPGIGGSWWGFGGFNIPTIGTIPYLASGAVIPPRSEFLAVLGDQKNGRNLETPEGLLRQIVREESGSNVGGTYRFIAQINRRTLLDEMITEAKMRQMTSGNNPFELA